jgi:hypothetical protein
MAQNSRPTLAAGGHVLYSILIYGSEELLASWDPSQVREMLDRHTALRKEYESMQRLGPVLRLSPNEATTVRRYKDRLHVTDGPFAETKEQLMGIYTLECDSIDEVVAAIERLDFESCAYEIRPVKWLETGVVPRNMPD